MTETCPTPKKMAFPTREAAYARLNEILSAPLTETLPNRAYECPCGLWHLTSHPNLHGTRALARPTPLTARVQHAEAYVRHVRADGYHTETEGSAQ